MPFKVTDLQGNPIGLPSDQQPLSFILWLPEDLPNVTLRFNWNNESLGTGGVPRGEVPARCSLRFEGPGRDGAGYPVAIHTDRESADLNRRVRPSRDPGDCTVARVFIARPVTASPARLPDLRAVSQWDDFWVQVTQHNRWAPARAQAVRDLRAAINERDRAHDDLRREIREGVRASLDALPERLFTRDAEDRLANQLAARLEAAARAREEALRAQLRAELGAELDRRLSGMPAR